MRKIFSFLTMFMLFVGMGWAQSSYVGVTKLPTKVKDPNALTTGYYMLKEVNDQAAEAHGWLKAASEAADAEVAPQGQTQPDAADCATYLWYIQVTGEGAAKTFTIGTVNKKAAWQAPNQRQKNLVAYANAGKLKLTTSKKTIGSTSATPKQNSAIITNEAGSACVHYSGGKLGSWTDANPASVMMIEFYEVPKSDLSTCPFKPSTLSNGKFGDQMHWYRVTMPSVDNRVLQLVGDDLHAMTSTPSDKSKFFAFVGNSTEGFAVYNLAAGESKTMASADATSASVVSMKVNNDQKWLVGANDNGFYLKRTTGTDVYLNRYNGQQNTQIKIWQSNQAASNPDSRFAFTEVDPTLPDVTESLPQHGKNYYFYNVHAQGNQYFYNDGAQIGWGSQKEYKKYVWTCEKKADGTFAFKNLASGRYFGWQALSNGAYYYKVSATDGVKTPGNVTLYSNDKKRFLVCKIENGNKSFDQASNATNDGKFSSDFHFTECTLTETQLKSEIPTALLSQNYNEKWVHLTFLGDAGYAAGVNGEAKQNAAANCERADLSAEDQLWCLVGNNTNGFKMYTRKCGQNLALKVANNNENTPANFVAPAEATLWVMEDKGGSYAICPKGATGVTLNAHGGKGNDLKLYRSSDAGGWWQPVAVDVTKPLTLSIEVEEGQPFANNTRVAEMQFNANGISANTRIMSSVAQQVYYIPGGKFNLSVDLYRGYSFDGFEVAESGKMNNFNNYVVPEGGAKVVARINVDKNNKAQYLFYTYDDKYGKPYRIPAIATAMNGDVIAISDYRPGGADVGRGEVDIKYRISTDGGQNWGAEQMLADGRWENGQPTWKYGFGDAAVVADRESNKVLVMMVCGNKNCWDGNYDPNDKSKAPNRVARSYGTYENGAWTFSAPEEVTYEIYPKFDKEVNGKKQATVTSLFIGSGRICQSRIVKKGQYYRLYCAVWTKNDGNRVIYSDDFGKSWNVLGTVNDRPAPKGDEPKCEELPDGRVILSSRKSYGRYFNVFTFNNAEKTSGTWGGVVASDDTKTVNNGIRFGGNSTNGEIMMVKAMKDGVEKNLMLQSVPTGGGRSNVAIFYKEINDGENADPKSFASNWKMGMEVSPRGSAYSTMSVLKNGNIAFFFEETPNDYCMVYTELSISEITGGAYTKVLTKEEQVAAAEAVLAKTGVGYPALESAARQTLKDAIAAYQTSEDLAALNAAVKAYKESVDNIQMPEDGKAYTFAGVLRNGTKRYMSCNENGVTWVADAKQATPWICRVIDAQAHTYAFVNNDNRFSIWSGVDSGYNGNKGYDPTFEADKCTITIEKMMKKGKVESTDQAELFGYVTYKGLRNRNNGVQNYIVNKTDNTFSKDGAGEPFFNNRFSSAILMEEVEYANTPKLNKIEGDMIHIQGADKVATFSAPFATVVPAGVSAFYIAAEGVNIDFAKLTKVEGAVPAGQGVILTADAATSDQVVMVPATAEAVANLTDNKLAATAGAAKELSGEFYLLGKYNGNVGLFLGNPGVLAMNKAYLPMTAAQAQGLKLVWNDEATGIEGVEAESATAPIYDLSGRRVLQTVKGGVYIQNGKKFIVK